MMNDECTSWKNVGKWYNEIVGQQGHYYHQTLIIPEVLKLLDFPIDRPSSLLDLACGQGVLSRHLPPTTSYVGIDAAAPLISAAKRYSKNPSHRFLQGDITQPFPLKEKRFSHATLLLAIQNIKSPAAVFQQVTSHLEPGAPLVMILNHPCFRIPRQSSWKVDEDQKIQYRRIDRYMSPLEIPIQMHPGKGQESTTTWSFHYPLSDYSRWLKEAGFYIDLIDEWCSNKVSEGRTAKMENRSRKEIPLFMALVARKRH